MSVNWKWSDKVGEIIYKEKEGKKTFPVSIYLANCLGCLIKEDKKTYQFVAFMSDKKHLERCLGLRKDFTGDKSNLFDELYLFSKVKEIKFTRYTQETKQMMDCFIRANYKVTYTPKKTKKKGAK